MEKFEFVNIGWQLALPLILMLVDIITGYYNAWKNDETQSKKMRDGLGKKLAEVCYIVVGFLIGLAFDIPQLGVGVSLYVILMEVVSITENCDKLGLPLPKFIKDKLNNEVDKIVKGDGKNGVQTKTKTTK